MTRKKRAVLFFLLVLVLFAAAAAGAMAQTQDQDDEFALIESAKRMRASGNVQFNFQDVDMVKFIRFMAELLNENLVLTPGVKGSISVISPKPFPLKEARQVFISVLEMNGYTFSRPPDSARCFLSRQEAPPSLISAPGASVPGKGSRPSPRSSPWTMSLQTSSPPP